MHLSEIMNTDIETVSPETLAEGAWNRMKRQHQHHLIVVADHEVVGILSARDLGKPQDNSFREPLRVADVMLTDIITAQPDTTIREAANLMRGFTIGCLPVLKNGKLVGVVTVSDLLELIGKGLSRGAILKERRIVSGLPPYLRPGRPQIT